VFQEFHPDVVIHAAAMAQPDECELKQEEALLVNVKATGYLLDAAASARSFFVYVSTDFVFSGNDGPYDEDSQPRPVNFYGMTKLMAEELVKQYPHGWAIARTVLVYGNVLVGTRANIISWVKGELEKGKAIKVVGDQLRSPTYAADLAAGLMEIAHREAGGVWHIAGKDLLSPWDIAQKVSAHLGLDSSLMTRVDASVFSQPATRPLKTPFMIDKARAQLGYEPHSFEEGMVKVLNGD
jgi:dTDP-4-dehydrorhamnose reductase